MPNKIRQRQQARADLDAIWDYIAADNPNAADALLHRIGDTLRIRADNPRAGRERPELAASLRSFPVGNYIVFYLPLSDGINVVRILSGYLDITAEDMD
jgi:toxin ParE1/3/4